jgi:hypothetical protein
MNTTHKKKIVLTGEITAGSDGTMRRFGRSGDTFHDRWDHVQGGGDNAGDSSMRVYVGGIGSSAVWELVGGPPLLHFQYPRWGTSHPPGLEVTESLAFS